MSGAINNGRRTQVKIGPVERLAGLVEQADGTVRIAFMAALAPVRGEKRGTVDGQPVAILAVDESGSTPGMVVVTARSID